MAAKFVPSKLKNICINKVVESIKIHVGRINTQPVELKDRILNLMSKRGSLQDSNIEEFLHADVSVLDLSESDITDDGLKKICTCNKLRKLDLNSCKGFTRKVSSHGIRCIAEHCKLLEVVFLRRCSLIDDDAIIWLAKCCPNLTQLNLDGCSNVTDASVDYISKNSSRLTSLNLSRTKVTDEGLKLLAYGCCAKQLLEIHVGYCQDITDAGINVIIDFCPKLRILIFHGCPLTTEQSRERMQTREMQQIMWTIY